MAPGVLTAVQGVQSANQRLAGVIGQIIVENAALGTEVETLRVVVAAERARADAAEKRVSEMVAEKSAAELATEKSAPPATE